MGNSVSITEKKQLAKRDGGKKKPIHYRLIYFNLKGRAETIRMLFALAGVAYEDVRVTHEEWPTSSYKKAAPFGQLPVLEIDGVPVCQQRTIERHLAREYGLCGQTPVEQTKVDSLIECLIDTMAPITSIYNEKDDAKKAEVMANFLQVGGGAGTLSFFLEYLKGQLVGPWYLGQQISLADVALYNSFDYLLMFVPTVLESHADLQKWHTRFAQHSSISQWIAKRPVTM